jgi:NAD(P)-dependent dehydrogenase (short-subunit alcohol dehydrogenase family)
MCFLNKVVLITGATGGIGKETAKAFASEGAKLALVDLEMESLETAAKELGLTEENYILIAADVTEEEQVRGYVQRTKDYFGKIDVFFNNAGIEGAISLLADYPNEAFDRIINVNLKGVYLGLKYVLRVMKEQSCGSIVNMASVAGLKGLPQTSAYNAAKHAVVGFTKSAAVEYAKNGIRVNAVCPAMINTRMMRSIEKGLCPENPGAALEAFKDILPMGRYGEPWEVAAPVLFLASEAASFITGVALPVDSGLIA